jgi:hypothetical protein
VHDPGAIAHADRLDVARKPTHQVADAVAIEKGDWEPHEVAKQAIPHALFDLTTPANPEPTHPPLTERRCNGKHDDQQNGPSEDFDPLILDNLIDSFPQKVGAGQSEHGSAHESGKSPKQLESVSAETLTYVFELEESQHGSAL